MSGTIPTDHPKTSSCIVVTGSAVLRKLKYTRSGFTLIELLVVLVILGLLAGLGILIIPWLMHGMGAGDVKLLAAIGVWLGPLLTFYAFILGAVIAGVAAVVMIISTGRLRMACANIGVILAKCAHRNTIFSEVGSAKSFGTSSQLLPYGVPLTAGTLIILAAKMFGWWGI